MNINNNINKDKCKENDKGKEKDKCKKKGKEKCNEKEKDKEKCNEKEKVNINLSDMLFLSNKELYDKLFNEKILEYNNITHDVIKYKKEIKTKMNKLLDLYLDDKNTMTSILKSNNDNVKYKNYFYNFLISLIENIKLRELKKSVSYDLSGYTNNSLSDVTLSGLKLDEENTYLNNANTLFEVDYKMTESNNNINNNNIKQCNLDIFANYKSNINNPKILPKKRIL